MLDLTDVRVHYGHVQAIRSVSLKIPQGCIFAVLGANGAGKTSLLRAIIGLSRATGEIRFEGKDIGALAPFERARLGIALVPEGRRLFPDFSVEENLRIGSINRSDRSDVESDIEELCRTFPVLKRRYQQRAQTLSGGEGQMLAIARAVISRPKMLLLDEPSVGLMPIAVTETFDMISKISRTKGITVLLVEQNARKALGVADYAAVLELGRLAFDGDIATLKADDRIKKAYLGA
jgi:branched-chain amino acid transport system ATP-binding protein